MILLGLLRPFNKPLLYGTISSAWWLQTSSKFNWGKV